MPDEFMHLLQVMAWPVAVLLAWWLGDQLHEGWRIPHVSSYAAVGLAAAWLNISDFTSAIPGLPFLANVTLSLVLFELGFRINLRWFRLNPWLLVTGVVETVLTFILTWYAASSFVVSEEVRLIVAALAMSASPAAIVRGANELRSAGQVTERLLHLCAVHCLLAVIALQLITGYWHLSHSGDWSAAAMSSVHALLTSVALGTSLALLTPWLLRRRRNRNGSVTVLFALLVILLTALSYTLKLSPLLAALAFGVMSRERRVQLNSTKRDFGSIGELLSVFLFVYVPSLIHWSAAWHSLLLGVFLVVLRVGINVICNAGFARLSGVTLRKGVLTGLSLTPMSAYAILLLEQSRAVGLEPADPALGALAGLVLILELFGPVVTQRSLTAAREVQIGQDRI